MSVPSRPSDGSLASTSMSSQTPQPPSTSSASSHRENFENEKQRIIQSCFSRTDQDGQLLECYITHVRVVEDAAHPSAPPPANAPLSSSDLRKSRVIIIAVRKSGRVRMHKARENNTGTFSIGKTWHLEDLSQIENNGDDNTGFTVTLVKPYYWQTTVVREKEAFVATLLRIYRKYTDGRTPIVLGFEAIPAIAGGGRPTTGSSDVVQRDFSGPLQQRQVLSQSASPNSYASNNNILPSSSLSQLSTAPSIESISSRQTSNGDFSRLTSTKSEDRPPSSSNTIVPPARAPGRPSSSHASISKANTSDSGTSLQTSLPSSLIPGGISASIAESVTSKLGAEDSIMQRSSREMFLPQDQEALPVTEYAQRQIAEFQMPNVETSPAPAPQSSLYRPAQYAAQVLHRQQDLQRQTQSEHPLQPPLVQNDLNSPVPNLAPALPSGLAPPIQVQAPPILQTSPQTDTSLPMSQVSPHSSPAQNSQQLLQSSRSGVPKKMSSRDVAAQFRLAASAYAAGGALSKAGRSRPPLSNSSSRDQLPPVISGSADTDGRPIEPPVRAPVRVGGRDMSNGMKISTVDNSRPVTPRDESLTRERSLTASSLRDGLPEKSVRRSEVSAASSNVSFETNIRGTASQVPQVMETPLSASGSQKSITTPPPASQNDTQNGSKQNTPNHSRQTSLEIPDGKEVPDAKQREDGTHPSTHVSSKVKRRRSTAATAARNKYMTTIDMTNMTVDIDLALEEFSWDGRKKRVDALEADVKKELAKVESGNVWLGHDDDDNDESIGIGHVEELGKLLDKAVKECEELDGLLTLYAVELMSLNDDIAYIENQSQGLQVQTANQKTLQRELELLLQTISIAPSEIETLQGAKIQGEGLMAIEQALIVLYKAMATIDPTLGFRSLQKDAADGEASPMMIETGLGTMVALKDKKEKYENDSKAFLGRLVEYMKIKYRQDLMSIDPVTSGKDLSRKAVLPTTKPTLQSHEIAYRSLYQFSGLIFFAKDVESSSYWSLLKNYTNPVRDLYQDEFRNFIFAWRKLLKKPTQEDQELLFTHTEKESDGVASTVRTLTVKRSQTLAKSLRAPLGESAKIDRSQSDGRVPAYEAFTSFLDEIVNTIAMEQNFLCDFFHLTSTGPAVTFLDFAERSNVNIRQPKDLRQQRHPESNRNNAKLLMEAMVDIFGFFGNDLQSFIETAIKLDPMQGVGILLAMERKINFYRESTNQEFLVKLLIKYSDQLRGMFIKFLKEQVRAIEATKVKIKKRKGVIDFMRTFPHFANKIEDQLPAEQTSIEQLEIREMVNNGYSIINRAMFDALQAIAKLSPQVASQSLDPEDKELLNYHIMMIENMNHYVEEVDTRSNSVLQDFKQKADEEYKEHLGLYIGAVIRRPLGKLLDFVESVEASEQTLSPEEIILRPSHSKLAFKKVLGMYDAKEMKEGIKTLGKRVDKHFSDGDEIILSAKLIEKIIRGIEAEYIRLTNRVSVLLKGVYKDSGLEMDWKRDEIGGVFTKLLK